MTTSSMTDRSDTLPFGPVLIGQTEKTLQALLRRALADTGISEPEWVTLRLAAMLDGQVDDAGLVSAVADRAKFVGTAEIVDTLIDRGLVADGRPTEVGREMVTSVLAVSDRANGSIWRDLPADDVRAATRVLNEVLRRARELAA